MELVSHQSAAQFKSLCHLSEKAVPGIVLSIYRLTPQKRLVQCAAPSLPRAMRPVFREIPIGRDVGSCGTAAWTGRQVRINDISTDSRWDAYRRLPLQSGLRACWSHPIKIGPKRVTGTVGMYFREPPRSSDGAAEALRDASRLASLLIQSQDRQEKRNTIVEPLPSALSDVLEALGLGLMSTVADPAILKAARGNLRVAQLLCRLLHDIHTTPESAPQRTRSSLLFEVAHDLGHAAGVDLEFPKDWQMQDAVLAPGTSRLLFWSGLFCSGLFLSDGRPSPVVLIPARDGLDLMGTTPLARCSSTFARLDNLVLETVGHMAEEAGLSRAIAIDPERRTVQLRHRA